MVSLVLIHQLIVDLVEDKTKFVLKLHWYSLFHKSLHEGLFDVHLVLYHVFKI